MGFIYCMLHGEKFTIREREHIKLLFKPTVRTHTHTHTYTVIPEKHQGYIMQSNTSRVHVHKQPTTDPITVTYLNSVIELHNVAIKGSFIGFSLLML